MFSLIQQQGKWGAKGMTYQTLLIHNYAMFMQFKHALQYVLRYKLMQRTHWQCASLLFSTHSTAQHIEHWQCRLVVFTCSPGLAYPRSTESLHLLFSSSTPRLSNCCAFDMYNTSLGLALRFTYSFCFCIRGRVLGGL